MATMDQMKLEGNTRQPEYAQTPYCPDIGCNQHAAYAAGATGAAASTQTSRLGPFGAMELLDASPLLKASSGSAPCAERLPATMVGINPPDLFIVVQGLARLSNIFRFLLSVLLPTQLGSCGSQIICMPYPPGNITSTRKSQLHASEI